MSALRRACDVAFAWAVTFVGFHIYWFLGGQFGFGIRR